VIGKTWTTAAGKTLTETCAARIADEFERNDDALDPWDDAPTRALPRPGRGAQGRSPTD
jgi:hypothetical protein